MLKYFLIFLNLIELFWSFSYKLTLLSFEEIVTIKVKGPGPVQIIFRDFSKKPDNICDSQGNVLAQGQSQITISEDEKIIIMKWNSRLTDLTKMFYQLESIIEVDFSQFDSSINKRLNWMFQGCINLKKVDFTNFQTSEVILSWSTFSGCRSLTSLDLSSFRTSINRNFGSMFSGCSSLTSLDLSKFDASSVTHMDNMFKDCILLTSLDLRGFRTINAERTYDLFNNCKSLVYINLPNLDLSKPPDFNNMFYGCDNLKYLNIINVNEKSGLDYSNFFNGVPENIIVCINEQKTPLLYEQIMKKKCVIRDCLDDLNEQKVNILSKNDSCTTYHFSLDNNTCYEDCDKNYLNENNNSYYYHDKNCIYKRNKCDTCSIKGLIDYNLCDSCNNDEGFYPMENDPKNKEIYHYCHEKSELQKYYYFDEIDSIFKLCYGSCETCDRKGNDTHHYCLACKYNYIEGDTEYFTELTKNKYKNCYENCPFYHYFDVNKNKILCTEFSQCPEYYDKLIRKKNECVNNCTDFIDNQYEFKKECLEKCPQGTTLYINNSYVNPLKNIDKNFYCEIICNEDNPFEILSIQECVSNCSVNDILSEKCIIKYETKKSEEDNIKAQKNILDNIENNLISGNYNTSNIEKGNDDLIRLEKTVITLTTSENQKNNENKTNLTSINLNECEKILRNVYNISHNKTIYIKKIDIEQEGYNIPKINFEAYYKLFENNLTKLNLSFCESARVDLSIPIEITESLDKLNISSGYYNDLCYTATSNKGTDIIIKDRKKEFLENNKTICQEDCVFSDYNYDTKKAKCSCNVEEVSFPFILDKIVINKTKLYKSFIDIKNIANINLLRCHKELFSKRGISKNIGFYIIIPIIIFHFISLIIFYSIKKIKINDKIKDISFGIKNWKLVEEEEKLEKLKKKKKKDKNKKIFAKKVNKKGKQNNDNSYKKKPENKNKKINSENIKLSMLEPDDDYTNNDNIINNTFHKNLKTKKRKTNKNNMIDDNYNSNTHKSKKQKSLNAKRQRQVLEKAKKIMKLNDTELNDLDYSLAKKLDKRTYCQYYLSLLRTKHAIFFSFFNRNDYNASIIKIDLFFISFTIYYTVNALFFNDDTIHKIYEDEGKFNFIYQLPQIVYSTLISTFLNLLFKLLALSEGQIISFKENKKTNGLKKREDELRKLLKIKFLLFFIFGTIFLISFWYYISMFGAIYTNTQIHLIKDTLISFGLSLCYPIGIYLLPGIFRIPSLSNIKNKRNCLYTFSKILQVI